MDIRFDRLSELSFDDSQVAKLISSANYDALAILSNNHNIFIELGFDSTQLTELATLHGGTALSIILNKIDQFPDLYSETIGFTAHDVYTIAKVNPCNIEVLFDNKFFVGTNEILTTRYFVECLSGNQTAVEQLQKIIRDIVSDLISYSETGPAWENENTKRRNTGEMISSLSQDPLIDMAFEDQINNYLLDINNPSELSSLFTSQDLSSTGFLQEYFQSSTSSTIDHDTFNLFDCLPTLINVTSPHSEQANVSDSPAINSTSSNLIYDDRHHTAKVITSAQLDEIEKDEDGNLYVMENNTKLFLFPKNFICDKKPSVLFNSMPLCLDKDEQFIGVVFSSDPQRNYTFIGYDIKKSATLADSARGSYTERRTALSKQLEAAKKMCVTLLKKVGIEYNPIYGRLGVFSNTEQPTHKRQPNQSTLNRTNLKFVTHDLIAKVVYPDQIDEIKKDENGNLYIMENETKLLLLKDSAIAKHQQPKELIYEIRFCLNEDDQFVGVVFHNNSMARPKFANYKIVSGRTWMDMINTADPERKKILSEQLLLARKTCSDILKVAFIYYKPRQVKKY